MHYGTSFDHHDDILLERFDTSDLKPRPQNPGSHGREVAKELTDSPLWAMAAE